MADNQYAAKLPITVDLINKICPKKFKPAKQANITGFVYVFNKYADYFGVDTPEEIAHFISQIAHESDDFNAFEEYASGKAYEGRKDLGNDLPGEGVKFKGRGPLQTTGDTNYDMTGDIMANLPFLKPEEKALFVNDGLRKNPALLADPVWGALSAFIYWAKKDMNSYCLPPDQKVSVKRYNKTQGWYNQMMFSEEAVCFRVNGGFNGLEDRKAKFKVVYSFFKGIK